MIVRLALKNIWRNRRRTNITISAIAFAVLYAVSMRSMQQGMEEQMVETIVRNNIGYLQVQQKDFFDEPSLDNGYTSADIPIDEIKSIPEISDVDKKLESGILAYHGNKSRGTYVMSLDQTEEIPEKITKNIKSGEFPKEGEKELLVGVDLAKYLKLKIGDTVTFIGGGYHGAMAADLYTVSGTIDFHIPEQNRAVCYTTMTDLQDLISAPDLITALLINVHDPDAMMQTKKKVEAKLDKGFVVKTWHDINPFLKQTIDSSDSKGWIMNFILYMIITFVLFGTILMATQERKYELGVTLAIGMKKWKSMLMVAVETIIISLLGVIVGVAIATPIAYYFHNNPIQLPEEQMELFEQFGIEAIIPFSVDPTIALDHASIVLTIAICLVFYPIIIIKRLNPVQAMKK